MMRRPEQLRDIPGNLPTPFIIALVDVAVESIAIAAVTNVLEGIIMVTVYSLHQTVLLYSEQVGLPSTSLFA